MSDEPLYYPKVTSKTADDKKNKEQPLLKHPVHPLKIAPNISKSLLSQTSPAFNRK